MDDGDVEDTETAVLVGNLPPNIGASFRRDRDITTLSIIDNDGNYYDSFDACMHIVMVRILYNYDFILQ